MAFGYNERILDTFKRQKRIKRILKEEVTGTTRKSKYIIPQKAIVIHMIARLLLSHRKLGKPSMQRMTLSMQLIYGLFDYYEISV